MTHINLIQQILEGIKKLFDLTPAGIRKMLDLAKPIYQKTSFFGHFGRESTKDGFFTWENIDKVDLLKKEFL